MEKIITVSVVLYNNSNEEILGVINSVDTSIANLVLFDNSNSSVIREAIKPYHEVTYVTTGFNMGFGKGHNYVFDNYGCNSQFFLALNPDVVFDKSLLSEMIYLLKNNVDIGLLTPKVFYPDNSIQETCRYLPSFFDLVSRRLGLQNSILDLRRINEAPLNIAIDVPFPLGCFFLLKSSVFSEIQGFDDRFFMYMEDLDLARRINDHGYRVVYSPQFSITHKYGKGSRKKLKLLFFHLKSMVSYYNKWGWIFDRRRIDINKYTREFIQNFNMN